MRVCVWGGRVVVGGREPELGGSESYVCVWWLGGGGVVGGRQAELCGAGGGWSCWRMELLGIAQSELSEDKEGELLRGC